MFEDALESRVTMALPTRTRKRLDKDPVICNYALHFEKNASNGAVVIVIVNDMVESVTLGRTPTVARTTSIARMTRLAHGWQGTNGS